MIGSLFAWAGATKVSDQAATEALLASLSPRFTEQARFLVTGLGVGEIGLGAWLISGVTVRGAISVAVLALLMFSGILMLAYATGYRGDCGCLVFGETTALALARNFVLLAALGLPSFLSTRDTHPLKGHTT